MIDSQAQTQDALSRGAPDDAAGAGILAPGTRVDTYVITRVIGQGGMGVVYLAEQEMPRRVVALKLVRPGRAAPELVRRFELEAHLLGRLAHHGIAQVYEAGVAALPDGRRAYLAMEYVPGRPLTEFANAKLLNIPDRLRLFMQVCEAVQHAHTKGVIHRDLKPANILATDDQRIKVLDFGVARDVDADATHTMEGQVIGTLSYMSPEQVGGNPNEIDTRTDVFALGVILFELLTGRVPLEVTGKPIIEAARIIREVEPPRLSQVQRGYAGDLETIVAKALEKEKARRYQSAGDLAADVERYLNDRPILARPPTAGYQFAKYFRRNKALVLGAAATLVAILAGGIVSSWQAVRARDAERLAELRRVQAEQDAAAARAQRATAERIADFLRTMLAAADPEMASGHDTTLLRMLLDEAAQRMERELADQPEIEAALRITLGTTYRQIGRYDEAERHLRRAVELTSGAGRNVDAETQQRARFELAVMRGLQSKFDEAEPELKALLAESRQRGPAADERTARILSNLGVLLANMDRLPEAQAAQREALAIRERVLGPHDLETTLTRNDLATVLDAAGQHTEAEALLRQVVADTEKNRGAEHPLTLKSMDNLAMALARSDKFDEAEELFNKALAGETRVLGETHPDTLITLNNLGFLAYKRGNYAAAAEIFARVVPLRRKMVGDDHVELAQCLNNLGKAREMLTDYVAAEASYREALAIYRRALPKDHPLLAATLDALAVVLEGQKRLDDAAAALRESLEIRKSHASELPVQYGVAAGRYGGMLLKLNELAEAEQPLLDGYAALAGSKDAPADVLDRAAERLATLYEARGDAAKAAEWRGKRSGAERGAD